MKCDSSTHKVWDIFCRLVDNFGDIGVCWRLARQLASEHGIHVRLWVDRAQTIAAIAPDSTIGLNPFENGVVELIAWRPESAMPIPGELVVEAFGCELPERMITAMLQCRNPPLWINLEYLSAEAWIEGCHLLPSPHPASGLAKHFFFPGFGADTGGLLCEAGLIEARNAFRADASAQHGLWKTLGAEPAARHETTISLFCYENQALGGLLDSLVAKSQPTRVLVPEGRILPALSAWHGAALRRGDRVQRGSLRIQVLPFVSQRLYDSLLWACDLNFVRGEDSLVRALWAGRPFVWQAYVQQDDAHLLKLEALLDRCLADMPAEAATAFGGIARAWNREQPLAAWLEELLAQREAIAASLESWQQRIRLSGDLATNLVSFSKSKLK